MFWRRKQFLSFGSAILEAIETKKRGGELSKGVIKELVESYSAGEVPDHQMSALLMAIFIQGMAYQETLALTEAMADSGKRYSFIDCVDKHSMGAVSGKISLTSLPIVAACGAPGAKISGRGLGTTGGTINRLEGIPGFSVGLSNERFKKQAKEVGLAIVEAGGLAPADKEIYALRDTIGTVDPSPLSAPPLSRKRPPLVQGTSSTMRSRARVRS